MGKVIDSIFQELVDGVLDGIGITDSTAKTKTPAYVVIYDEIHHDDDELGDTADGEHYFGYFDTVEEAERVFRKFSAGKKPNVTYENVKVCRVEHALK